MDDIKAINWRDRSYQLSYRNLAIGILCLLYMVGIVGIALPIHPKFVLLTPFNLMISLALVLYFHKGWNFQIRLFIGLAFALGYGAEVFGVQTGLLFGDYVYGPVLGPKLWGTPLMIGINWVMLAYCGGIFINYCVSEKFPKVLKALLASLVLVALDLLIEPVAIKYDFWQWPSQNGPPLHNYLGWFIVAFGILLPFMYLLGSSKNKVAIVLLILQLLFFSLLNIL